jgi:hypothetical protein
MEDVVGWQCRGRIGALAVDNVVLFDLGRNARVITTLLAWPEGSTAGWPAYCSGFTLLSFGTESTPSQDTPYILPIDIVLARTA